MNQPVTIPIFGSSSAQADHQHHDGQSLWQMEQGENDMDFDLLAEYLLEDNPGGESTSGMTFDFK
jgi:hypothetical protein